MRRIFLSIAVLAIGLSLAGCSDRGSQASSSAGMSANQSGDSAVQGTGTGTGESASKPSLISALDSRQVITSGSVSVTVVSPARAADDAARLTETAGGHVDGRIERAAVDGTPGTATLTLRIPSAQLTKTLDALKKLGQVENISLTKQDVTATSLDLAARITALRTSVDRLTALMTTAATTTDLITIESALSERQSSLESLESQARELSGQVEFATITLELGTSETAPVKAPADFLSGLSAGWGAFISFFAAIIVVAGVLVPWVISLGIIAAVAAVLVVRRNRRRTAQGADVSTS